MDDNPISERVEIMQVFEKGYLERKISAFREVARDLAEGLALSGVLNGSDGVKRDAVKFAGAREYVLILGELLGLDEEAMKQDVTEDEKMEIARLIEKKQVSQARDFDAMLRGFFEEDEQ